MKQKEIKNLAKKIAQQEQILQRENITDEERLRAENTIISLSACVKTIEDMITLDDAIQDLLIKNS